MGEESRTCGAMDKFKSPDPTQAFGMEQRKWRFHRTERSKGVNSPEAEAECVDCFFLKNKNKNKNLARQRKAEERSSIGVTGTQEGVVKNLSRSADQGAHEKHTCQTQNEWRGTRAPESRRGGRLKQGVCFVQKTLSSLL